MIKETLINRNPLTLLGYGNNDIPSPGKLGVVCARAGVGKTALLVQIALNALLRGKNVLHISLKDPVDKVSLWYKEVFCIMAQEKNSHETDQVWQSLLPHRFIMNFRVEGFSIPKLEERLMDLVSQDIFKPDAMIIDGLDMETGAETSLSALKTLAAAHSIGVWFSLRTHRHDQERLDEMPASFLQIADFFDIAIQLLPEGKKIHVKILKGVPSASAPEALFLDPSTMLVGGDSVC